MDNKEKQIFYSALFLSGNVLNVNFFRKVLEPINLENRILDYIDDFNKLELGIKIRTVSGGYQMVSDSSLYEELMQFFGEKTDYLTKSNLETLAVITYKQPITKIEIEEIRGVNSSGSIKLLVEKNLIKVAGRKNVPGRPILYATTNYFLEYFGLMSLVELPTLREWQELKNNL